MLLPKIVGPQSRGAPVIYESMPPRPMWIFAQGIKIYSYASDLLYKLLYGEIILIISLKVL